jgi:CheY-like chemotaxis protein
MPNEFLPERRSLAVRVLVVEDDPAIRSMAVDILLDAGFETLEAGDATEAIEALETSQHKIDILFTDVRMPGMNGLELARVAKRKHPELRVIVTSGQNEKELPTGAKFLAKPWCASDLLRLAA